MQLRRSFSLGGEDGRFDVEKVRDQLKALLSENNLLHLELDRGLSWEEKAIITQVCNPPLTKLPATLTAPKFFAEREKGRREGKGRRGRKGNLLSRQFGSGT
jgi:hypothetical protein